ncbi:hypothetical protein BDV98DRAFT_568437 [Pterulicium gracile]|uniref:Uncharacterized protein n=1 Tax=Pterulicium gracile TaxID=1884261 RepID=A0A5C3QRU7_9AGAR|nr:hypothetical protein BDV98DRAFT_568437 [Pterula gracilis]
MNGLEVGRKEVISQAARFGHLRSYSRFDLLLCDHTGHWAVVVAPIFFLLKVVDGFVLYGLIERGLVGGMDWRKSSAACNRMEMLGQ